MLSSAKRTWKLREFATHDDAINCVAFGRKSGQLMATGGDDKKVKFWAIGEENCLLTLTGHLTPIQAITFGLYDDMLCAGASSGCLKVWDLEANKITTTLTGHQADVKCINYHPFGNLIASGSADTDAKVWDLRAKGCLHTLKGHSGNVNCVRFSPDGSWLASAGNDSVIKLWDVKSGQLLTEFYEHVGPVHSIEYHPHELLLASGGFDRNVRFWSLDTLDLVGAIDGFLSPVRSLVFDPDGVCLFAGARNILKTFHWDPPSCSHSIAVNWADVVDMVYTDNHIIAASLSHCSIVSSYIVDIPKSSMSAVSSSVVASSLSCRRPSREVTRDEQRPRQRTLSSETYVRDNSLSSNDSSDHLLDDYLPELQSRSPVQSPRKFHSSAGSCLPVSVAYHAGRSLNVSSPPSSPRHLPPQFGLPSRVRSPTLHDLTSSATSSATFSSQYRKSQVAAAAARVRQITSAKSNSCGVPRELSFDSASLATDAWRRSRPTSDRPMSSSTPSQMALASSGSPRSKRKTSGASTGQISPPRTPPMSPKKVLFDRCEELAVIGEVNDRQTVTTLRTRLGQLQDIKRLAARGDYKSAVEKTTAIDDVTLRCQTVDALITNPSFVCDLNLSIVLLPVAADLLKPKTTDVCVLCAFNIVELVLVNCGSAIKSSVNAPLPLSRSDSTRDDNYDKCKVCHRVLLSLHATLKRRQRSSSHSDVPPKIQQHESEILLLISRLGLR